MSFEEFRAAAQAHRDSMGVYVLDGDIAIHGDEQLRRYWEQTQRGDALTVGTSGGADVVWTAAQKRNLTYCISDAFAGNKSKMVAAMAQATENGWMKFGDVKFIYMSNEDANCNANNNNVLFDINPVFGQPYLARAFFPDYPRSERNVLVDSTSFDPGLDWPLSNILAHELGHVLGFRHEHVRAPGDPCFEDDNWRGVTAYDAASVMHYPQCNGTSADLSFTQLDKQGTQTVYGPPVNANMPPMVAINAPVDEATVPPTFQVMTSIIDTDIAKGVLLIDGTQYQVLVAAPFVFQVTDLAEGRHVLQVQGTDAANQMVSQTIRVNVVKPAPEPEPEPEPGDDDDGGCNAGGAQAGLGLGLALIGLARRRRR